MQLPNTTRQRQDTITVAGYDLSYNPENPDEYILYDW